MSSPTIPLLNLSCIDLYVMNDENTLITNKYGKIIMKCFYLTVKKLFIETKPQGIKKTLNGNLIFISVFNTLK